MLNAVETSLLGKVALVTGAGSGLGEATARTLARAGARVAVMDVRQAEAKRVAQTISQEAGGDAARALGIGADVSNWSQVSRAIEKGETFGFIKILVHAETRQIVGATLFGPGCDEAIHCILTSMYARQPASLLTRSVHIHPTVAELIPTTLADLKPLRE